MIREADFRDHFSYWLDLMGEVPGRSTHLSPQKREALWFYIRAYEFLGVVRLFARYGRTSDPDNDQAAGLPDRSTIARRSFPVVSYMAYAFGRLGIRHVLIDCVGGLCAEAAGFADPEDAVFAISFTPYASETIAIANSAAERGVPLVAATDSPFSPLAQRATLRLEVVEADVEGFRSLSASFALVATLTVAVAERRREQKDGRDGKEVSRGPRIRSVLR